MKKKKRLKKPIRIFFKTSVVLCLLAALSWSGYELYKWGMERYQASTVEKIINDIVHANVDITTKDSEESEGIEEIRLQFTSEKWNKLHELNNDFIGWLAFDDEFVSEPLVQAYDNDFYLRRNFNKQADGEGSIFFDARNDIGADQNCTIYGHHVTYNQNAKLSPLTKLVNQEEFDKHNKFKIYYENYIAEYEITNIYYVDTSTNEFFNYMTSTFTDETIEDYIKYADGMNLIKANTNLNKDSRFITIQTCKDGWGIIKIIINCKELSRAPYE